MNGVIFNRSVATGVGQKGLIPSILLCLGLAAIGCSDEGMMAPAMGTAGTAAPAAGTTGATAGTGTGATAGTGTGATAGMGTGATAGTGTGATAGSGTGAMAGTGGGTGTAATLTQVFSVFQTECGVCHAMNPSPSSNGMLGALRNKEAFYAAVVSKPAAGPCAGKGNYVTPGMPAQSVLLQKLMPNPSCGVQMPQGGMLTAPEIAMFESWIMAGALNN